MTTALKVVDTSSTFEDLTLQLTNDVLAAVERFGTSRGLGAFDADAFTKYASVRLEDAVQEVLMFGLNRWPDDLQAIGMKKKGDAWVLECK